MDSLLVDVDATIKQLKREAWGKVVFAVWALMVLTGIILVCISLGLIYSDNRRLSTASARLDQAFAFDFEAFATTPCRTCEGTNLIVNADTPMVVSPFIGLARQFPTGIKTPCYASSPTGTFQTRADATVNGGTQGITVDANTLLTNQQGLHLQNVETDCMGAVPCLPATTFCQTEFGATKPFGPIYRYTRTNVGSGMDTLVHLCACVYNWDPIGETMITRPYCTEPLA